MRTPHPFRAAVRAAVSGWTVQPWRVRVARVLLPTPAAVPGMAGLRVVFVSDLHVRHADRGIAPRVVRLLEALRPDLVLVGGDTHDGPRTTAAAVEHLSRYRAPLGVFVVPGNHEHGGGVDLGRMKETLAGRGVTLLLNEGRTLHVDGAPVHIAGVDDPATGHDDLDAALAGAPPGAWTLLLAHAGVLFEEAEARGIPLVLSGHSHGGQVRLPLVGIPWLPRRVGPCVRGLHGRNGTTLFVSSGAGTSVLPVRYDCPPEVVLLEWSAGARDRLPR